MKLFDQFTEINIREEKTSISNIEKLLHIEGKVMDLFKQDYHATVDSMISPRKLYEKILDQTKIWLEDVEISEKVLQRYIDARENTFNIQTEEARGEATLRGIYSGVLLELLCQKTDESVSFNGHGRNWSYLFYSARNIKNVSITHFSGNYILSGIGTSKGEVKNISASHIVGDNLLNGVGILGTATNIFAHNIEGNNTLADIGMHGKAEGIIAKNIRGYCTLRLAGSRGDVSSVVILHNMGNVLLQDCALIGKLSNVLIDNIHGEGTLSSAGKMYGIAENIFTRDIIGRETYKEAKFHNHREYETMSAREQMIFNEIVLLAESMETTAISERENVFEKIKELQNKMIAEEET